MLGVPGEVPTSVTMPPKSEPKAMGIRKLEGGVFARRAIWNATGIIIASAPIFFTKADRTVTDATSTIGSTAPPSSSRAASMP